MYVKGTSKRDSHDMLYVLYGVTVMLETISKSRRADLVGHHEILGLCLDNDGKGAIFVSVSDHGSAHQ